VVMNSAPTEGVIVAPPSQLRATWPALRSPANRHKAVELTFEEWNYAFTNTFPEADARRAYERYYVPASGAILWGSVLANFEPGHQDVWVNYQNDNRAPLLFLSAEHDHLMPPVVQRSNVKHYKSHTITELEEIPGRSHLMPAQQGWEEVADKALAWALDHAGARSTHVGQRG
jgi:pimeloyl-ACP methyl ester carboxylesterase